MSRGKASAIIDTDKKGEMFVKIVLPDGRKVNAYNTGRGILYDKPEWVPRVMKLYTVPDLFKEIRRRILST